MIRKIIQIDEEKCVGCGKCAEACHEGAIAMVNGKARLMRDDYCDGLGDCLPVCPTDAITFVHREAAAYDEAAVLKNKEFKTHPAAGGCPGSRMRNLQPQENGESLSPAGNISSQLRQWPAQLKLVPINAPYFQDTHLLIAADCTAYAYGNFHQDFIRGRVVLIACPKLDNTDYSEKLTQILLENHIQDITVVRMEVPCCGGIEYMTQTALQKIGKDIPFQVVTLSIDGQILS